MKNKFPKHENYNEWLRRQFNSHVPTEIFDQTKKLLESKSETTNLFIGLAGLALIADGYGDKKGYHACTDALKVLANAHCNVSDIWRE